MNDAALLWTLGLIISALGFLFVLWIKHMLDCRDIRERMAESKMQRESLQREVDSLRETRHEHAQLLQELLTKEEMRERDQR